MTGMHTFPTDPPMMSDGDDREVLSALFDGELEADAARFAQRRLVHDGQWREACGRWQLAGDLLRRRADAVAPAGFADRVARAMADEALQAGSALPLAAPSARSAANAASRSSRRRWVPGAALAASVAVAALFVVRPLSSPDPAAPGASPSRQVAATLPSAAGVAAAEPDAAVATAADPGGAAEAGLAAAAATVAVAEVPRRNSERRSRGQVQRAALRVARREPSRPVAAAGASAGTVVASAVPSAAGADAVTAGAVADAPGDAAGVRDPFHPGVAAGTVSSKPWPRAVLPGYDGQGGYTVGYGEPVPTSPSFYPFEPRLPEAGAADPPPADPQPRR